MLLCPHCKSPVSRDKYTLHIRICELVYEFGPEIIANTILEHDMLPLNASMHINNDSSNAHCALAGVPPTVGHLNVFDCGHLDTNGMLALFARVRTLLSPPPASSNLYFHEIAVRTNKCLMFDDDTICPVCLDDMRDKGSVVKTICHHLFCETCLLKCMATRQKCPVCSFSFVRC